MHCHLRFLQFVPERPEFLLTSDAKRSCASQLRLCAVWRLLYGVTADSLSLVDAAGKIMPMRTMVVTSTRITLHRWVKIAKSIVISVATEHESASCTAGCYGTYEATILTCAT